MEAYLSSLDTLDARRFTLAIKRLADSLSFGFDRSPFLGAGVEYVQSRPYLYGDPIKTIDWRVTARVGEPYVKEYEAPKRMPCYLLVDTSASMAVSSLKRSKYAVAVHLAGGLALACLDRVSPVGVIGVGGRDVHVTPSLGQDQVMQWLHQLRRYRFDEPTTLASKVTQLVPTLNCRSLLIVLSDLHDPMALQTLKQTGQQHDCVVLQLMDPAEKGLPGSGIFRATEAETGRQFVTHGRKQWVDPQAAAQSLRRAGIDHLLVETDQPIAMRLRQFFEARGVLGKGAR